MHQHSSQTLDQKKAIVIQQVERGAQSSPFQGVGNSTPQRMKRGGHM